MKKYTALFILIVSIFSVIMTSCANTGETIIETDEITTAEVTVTETETETETETVTEEETETQKQENETTVNLSLPDKSADMSYDTALQLLSFASGYNEKSTASLLKNAGFEVLFSKNYDKPFSDTSHTCAYTVAKGRYNGKNVYAVVIRGTYGGEWYSNFDFAPSHNNDTQYAENFFMAAQDIYLSVKDLFDNDPDSYKVICGHSRGAAASNLLGVLLDSVYDRDNIYVYTFATPNTVRGTEAEKEYNNIFNFINPADTVVYVPLKAHGFSRAGTDIMLDSEDKKNDVVTAIESLSYIAPDIRSYYEEKYSLTEKGLSDDGMSVFDIFKFVASMYASDSQQMDLSQLQNISPESDLYAAVNVMSDFSDTQKLLTIANEHAVSRYSELIREKQAEE